MAEPEKSTSIIDALRFAVDQPLENFGTTLQAMGYDKQGQFLKDLLETPENYEVATEKFLNREGEGFDFSYLPRSVLEQVGQLAGSLATRAGFAVGGAAVGGLPGAAAGALLGPALFEAAQIAGPVALARAQANGREEPNWQDWTGATGTATASGLLNAFGVRGLGKLNTTIYGAAAREGVTEGLQGLTEQIGSTALTDQGLEIDPKSAVGEAIIGGTTGAAFQAPVSARTLVDQLKQEIDTPPAVATTTPEPEPETAPIVEQPAPEPEPEPEPEPAPPPVPTIAEILNPDAIKTYTDVSPQALEIAAIERVNPVGTFTDTEFREIIQKTNSDLIGSYVSNEGEVMTTEPRLSADSFSAVAEGAAKDKKEQILRDLINSPEARQRFEDILRIKNAEVKRVKEEFGEEWVEEGGISEEEISYEDVENYAQFELEFRPIEEGLLRRAMNAGELVDNAFRRRFESDVNETNPDFNLPLKKYLDNVFATVASSAASKKFRTLPQLDPNVRADNRYKRPDLVRKLEYNPLQEGIAKLNKSGVSTLTYDTYMNFDLTDTEQLSDFLDTIPAEAETELKMLRQKQDLIDAQGGASLLERIKADPVFGSTSLIREALDGLPDRATGEEYLNFLKGETAQDDQIIQQEIEDSDLDKFLQLNADKVINKTEIDDHMQGHMGAIKTITGGDTHPGIGINKTLLGMGNNPMRSSYQTEFAYLPRLNANNEKRIKEIEDFLSSAVPEEGYMESVRQEAGALSNISEIARIYRNSAFQLRDEGHFDNTNYGKSLFHVRDMKGEVYRDFDYENGGRPIETTFIIEIQNDFEQRSRDAGQPETRRRVFEKQQKEIDKIEEDFEVFDDIKGFIDTNRLSASIDMPRLPDYPYFNETETEQKELFDVYRDAENDVIRHNEKSGKHARPLLNKYSPLYNFATLVGDAEVPKYFYDNSVKTDYKKTLDQLAAIQDQIDRDYEGDRYDAPSVLINKLELLEAKGEWLSRSKGYSTSPIIESAKLIVDQYRDSQDLSSIEGDFITAFKNPESVEVFAKALMDNLTNKQMKRVYREAGLSEVQMPSIEQVMKHVKDKTLGFDSLYMELGNDPFESATNYILANLRAGDKLTDIQKQVEGQVKAAESRMKSQLQYGKKLAEAYQKEARRIADDVPSLFQYVDELKLKMQNAKQIPDKENPFNSFLETINNYKEPYRYQGGSRQKNIPLRVLEREQDIDMPFGDSYIRKSILNTIIRALDEGTDVSLTDDKNYEKIKTETQMVAGGTYDKALQELRRIADEQGLTIYEDHFISDERADGARLYTVDLQPLRDKIESGEYEGFKGFKKGGLVPKKMKPATGLFKVDYGDYGRTYK